MFGAPTESHYLLLVYQNPPAMQDTWVRSLGWENPLEKGMVTHYGTIVRESHGERNLMVCSPQGHTESDMT